MCKGVESCCMTWSLSFLCLPLMQSIASASKKQLEENATTCFRMTLARNADEMLAFLETEVVDQVDRRSVQHVGECTDYYFQHEGQEIVVSEIVFSSKERSPDHPSPLSLRRGLLLNRLLGRHGPIHLPESHGGAAYNVLLFKCKPGCRECKKAQTGHQNQLGLETHFGRGW